MNVFRKDEGFTLIEILMAIFIGLVLMAAVYVSMNSGQRSSSAVERKVAAQQDVRAALDVMAMEVSMASYNPNFMTGLWRNPPNAASNPCTGTSVNQTWKGIQEATPTSITVEMDIVQNGVIGAPDANEIIRYAYDAGNQYVTRTTNANCSTAEDFLGNQAASPGTRTVRVINNTLPITNGNNVPAIFRYYSAENAVVELYPDANPTDILKIRRIDITLGVETEDVDPGTQQRRRMIYSTSVLVRNHAIN